MIPSNEGQLNGVAGGDQNHTIFIVSTHPSEGAAHSESMLFMGNGAGEQCIGISITASKFSWWHWDSAATDIIYNLPNSKLPNPSEPFITKMRYKGEASTQPTSICPVMGKN